MSDINNLKTILDFYSDHGVDGVEPLNASHYKFNFKNVYYDNAATIFLYDAKIYHLAKELGIMEKVLFGSDYPLLSPERYWQGLAESKLAEEDLKMLLGNNAVKLFNDCGIRLDN